MWKKVVLFFITISLIFNSGLNEIVIFANTVDKGAVEEKIKNLFRDFEIEDEVLIKYKGKDKEVVIPEEVKYIGEGAFENNKKIEKIIMHSNINSIEESAFKNCENLSTIIIPSRVDKLNEDTFENCESLEHMIVLNDDLDISNLLIENANEINFYGLEDSQLERYTEENEYEFYEIVSVDSNENIKALKKGEADAGVYINSDYEIVDINEENLDREENKENINENEEKIISNRKDDDLVYGDFTYKIDKENVTITGYMGSSTSVSIPSSISGMSVTKIGSEAFENLEHIKSINLPESIIEIEYGAFLGIELETFKLPSKIKKIGRNIINSSKIRKVFIPKTVESMGMWSGSAFSECKNLDEVEFEKGRVYIPADALINCQSITKVIIPDSVTIIGDNAFENCKNLVNLKLSDNIKEIGAYAFLGIEFESFELPSKLEHIGIKVFNSSKITKMFVPKTVESMGMWSGSAFSECKNLEEVEFEAGRTHIPADALINCQSITKVIIPNSVTTIGDNAFENCKNLVNLKLSDNIVEIGYGAFLGIEFESFKLPPKIKKIGRNVINSSKITKMFIPKTVESMGMWSGSAFSECKNLKEVEFEDGMTKIPNEALNYCSNVTKVTIPKTVISISNDAFDNIKKFTIYGYNDSFAQSFAYSNNISFKDIGEANLLETLGLKEKLSNISFNGGTIEGPSIKLLGKVIPLFEVDASAYIPLDESIQVKVDAYTKTIEVLIGFKDFSGSANLSPEENSNAYWKESYKQVKSLYKGMTGNEVKGTKAWNDFSKLRGKLKKQNATLLVNGNLHLAGYMEFNYESGEIKLSEGGIISEVGISTTKTFRWTPPWSAVYTILGFDTGANGKIYLNENKDKIQLNTNLGANFGLNAGIGAGSKKLLGGFYAEGVISGTLNGNLKLPASNVKDALSISCDAAAKLAVVALGFDLTNGKLAYEFPSYSIYPQKTREYLFAVNSSDIDLDKATPISRDYLNHQISTYSMGEDFIKENIYPYNSPELINLDNNKKMLIWIDDNGEKSTVNRTSLMYSVFSGGRWSTPQTIAETGTYNDIADIYVNNGKVHILWRKSNKVLSDNASIKDLMESTDLYYTVYDGEKFSEAIQVTSNNTTYEMNYAITANDDKVAITWVENSNNDITLESGSYSLYAKEYINNQPQEKVKIASSMEEINNTDIDYINNKYAITYSITDNSSQENQKSDIYLYNNGNSKKINLENDNGYLAEFIDKNLYFINNDDLMIYNTSSQEIEETGISGISNFSVVSNGNSKAVVTMIPNDESFELMASYYNKANNTWGSWKQVTSNEQFIRTYSVVMNDDASISAALSLAEMTDKDDSVFGKSSLIVSGLKEISDLSVEDGIYYDYDKVVSNGKLDLNFNVYNNSSQDLESLNISILDENNKVLQQSDLECKILANETKEVTYTYNLPKTIKYGKIKVLVKSNYDEVNTKNNVVETSIGYGDVSLEDVEIKANNNQYVVTGKLSNIGHVDVNDVKLSIHETDANGEVLQSININTLKVGQEKDISYTLPKDFISNNVDKELALYLNVESSTQEATLTNNECRVLFTPAIEEIPVIEFKDSTSNSILFTWNKIEDCSGYAVYRYNETTKKYEEIDILKDNNITTYEDKNLSSGQIYKYKIRPYKEVDGEKLYKSYSEEISLYTKPGKVSIVKATPSTYNSNKVTWNKVSGADGYEVYRATSKTGTYSLRKTTSKDTLYYTNTSLSTGKTYYYKVRAYKLVDGDKKYGDFSSVVSAKPVLSSTTAKALSASYNSNNITWNKVSGADGYEVYRATSQTGTYSLKRTVTSGSTLSYKNTSLSTGRTYYYKVRAYRLVNGDKKYGDFSSVVSAKPVLSSTTAKAVSASYNSNNITWNKVSGADGYEVYRATSQTGTYSLKRTVTSGSTLSYKNTSLTTGKNYYYKVKAYRMVSGKRVYSSYSRVVSAKPLLSTPSVTLSAGTKKAYVKWSKVSGASGYEIYRTTSKTGKYSKVKDITKGSTTSYTNSSLTSKKGYYYKVKAYRTINGKRVYSSYSSVKYIKVK